MMQTRLRKGAGLKNGWRRVVPLCSMHSHDSVRFNGGSSSLSKNSLLLILPSSWDFHLSQAIPHKLIVTVSGNPGAVGKSRWSVPTKQDIMALTTPMLPSQSTSTALCPCSILHKAVDGLAE